jgi:uncharacterized membrane protein YdjX (TVP38/TMEM64 family)
LSVWIAAIALGAYFYIARTDVVRDEFLILSSTSKALAGTVYFALGSLRGFTLIPVTYLIPFGLLFLSPVVHFLLTIGGILVSSASIYYLSERLRLAQYFEKRHADQVERTRRLLRRRELPIVIALSFFPFAPTDLICYVCGSLGVDIRKMLAGILVGEGPNSSQTQAVRKLIVLRSSISAPGSVFFVLSSFVPPEA